MTQGQGQVTPEGSYFFMRIWNRSQKTPFKMSNRSPDILKSLRICRVLEFVKVLKSHWEQCKFGIFSKWCVSFGQECMVLNHMVFVTKTIGKMKYAIKFIYLHSSAKNTTFHGAFPLRLSIHSVDVIDLAASVCAFVTWHDYQSMWQSPIGKQVCHAELQC